MPLARTVCLLAAVAGFFSPHAAAVKLYGTVAQAPDEANEEDLSWAPPVDDENAAPHVEEEPEVKAVPKNACDGCELTVDLECHGIRPSRSAPFHRVQDCLVPLYGLIDIARNASRQGKKVCALTWLDIWEGLNLRPFLLNLTDVPWHSLINEREECGKSLQYHAINRTHRLVARDDWMESFGSDPNMIKSHRVDLERNVASLKSDVARVVAGEEQSSSIVLLSRRVGTRKFRPLALQELLGRLTDTGLPIEKYSGKETVVEVVKMFNRARAVLGYHGAAWVNTYFSPDRVCAVELSTYYDLESTKPWRTSMGVGLARDNVLWYHYLLPLGLLLDANHVMHSAYVAREEKDHFIKDFEWIPMRDVDIDAVAGHLTQCTADPAAYERAHPDHDSKINTRGWEPNQEEVGLPSPRLSGKLASIRRDACSGCDVTVDLRCEGTSRTRGTYYGSVAHCLLPAYEMLQVAREAAANSSTNVCAITTKEGFSLRPYLRTVADIRWYKMLDSDSHCIEGMRYHTFSWSTALLEKSDLRLSEQEEMAQDTGLDAHVIHSYPVDMVRNLDWMQKDSVNLAGRPTPHVIVLQNRFRLAFPEPTLDLLSTKLGKFMEQPVTVFSADSQNIRETVKLFANAGSVVGFHGSLFVNTLFTYTPHCLVEMSTYQDLEKTKEWRTNVELTKLNPIGDWHFLHFRLQGMLQGNNFTAAKFLAAANKDAFILNMPLAIVPDQDILDVASRIYLCWQNKVRAYTYATESWDWHGHA